MRRSLAGSMAGAYRAPRAAVAGLLAGGPDEARSLVHLMLACGLFLVASLPGALRMSRAIRADDPVSGSVAAHVFAYLFVAPLLFYGLAALIHLAARRFGGAAGYAGARVAVFWTLLLGAPLALVLAMVRVITIAAPAAVPEMVTAGLRYGALAYWLWLLAAGLSEAEGFAGTGRVAAVFAGVFAGLAALSVGLSGARAMF